MKRINGRGSNNLDNQQNKNNTHDHNNSANIQKITPWDDEKPLLQHNLNTFGSILTKLKENKQFKKSNIIQYINANKSSQKRKRPQRVFSQRASSVSHKNPNNIQTSVQMHIESSLDSQNIPSHTIKQPLKYEFSNIQLLKFHVKHLQNEQLNNRLPNFSHFQSQVGRNLYRNQTYYSNNCIYNEPQENINQFQLSEIYEIRRKLRTQSTKRKQRQKSQIGSNNCSQLISYASADLPYNEVNVYCSQSTYNPNNKFYRTLANEWIQSRHKNSLHLMVQPPQKTLTNTLCIQPLSNQKCIQKITQIQNSSLVGSNDSNGINIQNMLKKKDCRQPTEEEHQQHEYKTIHWKRNKPFTKFFQYKRSTNLSTNTNTNGNTKKSSGNKNQGQVRSCLKQIEGRKLQQIFSINRQIIDLQDL